MTLPSLRLDGQIAIVTGASGGLGSLAARALAEAGADVVAVARSIDRCERTAQQVRDLGRRAIAMRVDVTSSEQVGTMVDATLDAFGRIDILFNNAGITSPRTLLESTEEEWLHVVDVNIRSTFLCSKRVGAVMKGQQYGRIINMGSILSGVGMATRTAYSASKAGIANLARALAHELGPFGVTVNTLAPSVIITDLNRELIQTQPHLYDAVIQRTALKRLGQPEDIAGALVFLASPAAAYVTGQTLFVDGGYTAG